MMICLFLSGVAGAQQAQCQSRRLTTMDADEEENMSECSSLNPKPSSTEPCTLMCHLVPSPSLSTPLTLNDPTDTHRRDEQRYHPVESRV